MNTLFYGVKKLPMLTTKVVTLQHPIGQCVVLTWKQRQDSRHTLLAFSNNQSLFDKRKIFIVIVNTASEDKVSSKREKKWTTKEERDIN